MARAPGRTHFLGLGFDPMGTSEAARVIAARARRLEPFAYVATPNVDHVVRADRMPELRTLYDDAWLNLCDSRILEVFAERVRSRITGATWQRRALAALEKRSFDRDVALREMLEHYVAGFESRQPISAWPTP